MGVGETGLRRIGTAFEPAFARLFVFAGLLFCPSPFEGWLKPLYWTVVLLGLFGLRLWLFGTAFFAFALWVSPLDRYDLWSLMVAAGVLSVAPGAELIGVEGIYGAIRRADHGVTAVPSPPRSRQVTDLAVFVLGLRCLLAGIGLACAFWGRFGWAFLLFAAFDWPWVAEIFGRLFSPNPLIVAYDGKCKLCRRTAASLRTFDVLGRIDWVEAQDEAALAERGYGDVDPIALVTDIHGFIAGRIYRGYECYKQIAWRIPILWPIAPLLYLLPVAWVGRKVYRRIADSRTCTIRSEPVPTEAPKKDAAWLAVLVFVGLLAEFSLKVFASR